MKELALQIQRNPDQKDQLLDSYKTDSQEVRDFLDSLKGVVVYVVPALLDAFSIKHVPEDQPKTLEMLMTDKSFVGTLFYDDKETLWQYLGVSTNGFPLCRIDSTMLVHELPKSFPIKWLF